MKTPKKENGVCRGIGAMAYDVAITQKQWPVCNFLYVKTVTRQKGNNMYSFKNDITVCGFTAFLNRKNEWVFPGRVIVKSYDDAMELATKYANLLAKAAQ